MPENNDTRPIPMLGEISLSYTQRIEQSVQSGFISIRIPGLSGQAMQQTNRHSHCIDIKGVLFGESAKEDLETLQSAAVENTELTFSASISEALDIQQVVIESFRVSEEAGRFGFYQYALSLKESPPLPPPAEVSSFGGLDEFGVGDLGFDTDILGDMMDEVSAVTDAIDQATQVLDQLGALTNLEGLSVGGLLEPMDGIAGNVGGLGSELGDAIGGLLDGFNS